MFHDLKLAMVLFQAGNSAFELLLFCYYMRTSPDHHRSLNIPVLYHFATTFGNWGKQSEMVQYSQLDPQKSEIRLVTLLPGKPCDSIRCTLSTASLDQNPAFTALSYVWGDPSATKPITVDGEPFDVTLNLEEGLRAIRERGMSRVLWIDAICINQKDVNEKNVQVPQMGRLYSNAPEVLAWLGPSSPNIGFFVSWIRAHAKSRHIAASAYWLKLKALSVFSRSMQRKRNLALVRAYKGFLELLALSYWDRVWTFQEYLLPRVEPMFLCGHIKPFQLSTVLGHLNPDNLKKLWHEMQESRRTECENSNEVREFERLRKERDSARSSTVLTLPSLRSSPAKPLAKLLWFTADRQCFHQCDKIYALYGVVPDAQNAYPPDYSRPITQVMLQAAAYMVNIEHTTVRLWPVFGLRHDRLLDSRLYPSWMPDFSTCLFGSDIHIIGEGRVAMPLARREDTNKPAFVSLQNATLRFGARCLGTCKVAVRFAGTVSKILEQMNGLLRMDVLEDKLGNTVRKPQTIISRMTRVFFAHWPSQSNYSTKEILETISLVLESGPDSLRLGNPYFPCWIMIENAVDHLRGKALLRTEDGCFGVSVGGAEDGDIIVIPPEVEVPLVLKPESRTSADQVAYYKMVGTAIIDGVMGQGELFDEEFVQEIAERDVVEFLVH